ncbi:MAG: PEP-CTERM sorting domain-containing protein [Propionivibrio sp.]|nr:PEP-CTERM sorting domain-containing protein [Propionivibrio sp.]
MPEPGSTAMMVLGLATLLVRRLYWHRIKGVEVI